MEPCTPEDFSPSEINTLKVENARLKTKVDYLSKKNLEVMATSLELGEKVTELSRRNMILLTQLNSVDNNNSQMTIGDLDTMNRPNTCQQNDNKNLIALIQGLLALDYKARTEILRRRKRMAEKCIENFNLQEELKKAVGESFEAKKKVEKIQSEFSEQILKTEELQKEQKATTAVLEQMIQDMLAKNTALKEQENALNRVKNDNFLQKVQLEQAKMVMQKLQWNDQEMKTELFVCKSKLEDQRKLIKDLQTKLKSTTNENGESSTNKENVDCGEPHELQLGMKDIQKAMLGLLTENVD